LNRELLISASLGEWRVALLEDGVPVELFVERGDRSKAGSIYLGRVRRLVPALGAALVDIGGERPAFLPRSELIPRGKRVDEGERVLVQIRREAQGGKAARATMRIALRGRLVELRLGQSGRIDDEMLSADARSTFSRSAGESAERSEAGEGDFGVRIIKQAPMDALAAEAVGLRRRWHDILDRASRLDPPARIYPVATFAAALMSALPAAPSRIFINEPAAIPDIRAAFTGIPVENRPEADWPIELDAVFDETLCETVMLHCGGSVHIQATRAGVMIDVDTGTPETGTPERTGLAVNLAAAAAIAQQIRLRNIGGGIIVDFVGLDSRPSRERVRAELAEALARDPVQPQILGWTRLGHLELVRPRRGLSLAAALLEPHPGGALVKSAITVAHEALRTLRREARAQPGRNWRLTVAPDVAAALASGAAPALREVEDRLARKIAIDEDLSYGRERFRIAPL
jgi:ribonuclease G